MNDSNDENEEIDVPKRENIAAPCRRSVRLMSKDATKSDKMAAEKDGKRKNFRKSNESKKVSTTLDELIGESTLDESFEDSEDEVVFPDESISSSDDEAFEETSPKRKRSIQAPARKKSNTQAKPSKKSSTLKASKDKQPRRESSLAMNSENNEPAKCFAQISTKTLLNFLNNNNQQERNRMAQMDLKLSLPCTAVKQQNDAMSESSDDGDHDDWVEMERIDDAVFGTIKDEGVQITLDKPIGLLTTQFDGDCDSAADAEAKKWEKMIRLELARRRRELFENMHKFHILCYIAHLRFHVGTVISGSAELAQLLSGVLPSELLGFCPAVMDKVVDIFRSIFRFKREKSVTSPSKYRNKQFTHVRSQYSYLRYLKELILSKTFPSDKELAVIFFALCYCVLKLNARLVVSFDPMSKVEHSKENKISEALKKKKSTSAQDLPSSSKKPPRRSNVVLTSNALVGNVKMVSPSKKLMEKSKRQANEMSERRKSTTSVPSKNNEMKMAERRRSARIVGKKLTPELNEEKEKPQTSLKGKRRLSSSSSSKVAKMEKVIEKYENFSTEEEELPAQRNYWVEYYDDMERRWICIDPMFKTVDRPAQVEKYASQPMTYVMAVDNEMGVRELCAKYSGNFLSVRYRKLRTEDEWLTGTLSKELLCANENCARLEDAQIRRHLLSLPLPEVVSEYKNHPLYALEKDLLKFEALYPSNVEPLGTIRSYKIFPRSAVYTLQGELNWLKLARVVKEGEEPYKVVNARPKCHIPKEKRVPLYLKVYGYWQTEPFVPPEVVDGKIPRNDHGNIYLYQQKMLPKGCAHLRLNGIYQIARRMQLEAVPAIVGWDYSGGTNHPTIDGCAVLEKDVEVLKEAWRKTTQQKAEKEEKRARERVWNNWKRLIKGKILLEKMRNRFK